MHVHVIGGGLAGVLLAWRLGRQAHRVTLTSGGASVPDATAVSGGVVRGFELDVEQRALALAGLQELDADPIMREWAALRTVPCAYLPRASGDDVRAALAEIEASRPGTIEMVDASTLERRGLSDWSGDAVWEHGAGVVDPERWRTALLADLAARENVRVVPAAFERLAGGEADVTVLATGAWTPALLRQFGLPADGYRTKAVDYTVFDTEGWMPSFVDESTGLYGRPVDGGVLLGRATDEWNVAPGARTPSTSTPDGIRTLARRRLAQLELGDVRRQVAAADCYTDVPVLRLRRLTADVLTFTGGSGGAAKTALAASARAADDLIAHDLTTHDLTTHDLTTHDLTTLDHHLTDGPGNPGSPAAARTPIPTGRSPRP